MNFASAARPRRTLQDAARRRARAATRLLAGAVLAFGCAALPVSAQAPFSAGPEIDKVMEKAVAEHRTPGGVVLIGQPGRVLYEKAYGERSLIPTREPASVDTIYDAASLTKVIATTSAMMKLFEQGKIRLNDRVTEYLPQFQGGKSPITIRNLMTHFSGLRPDLDLTPEWSGYETGIRLALAEKSRTAPGEKFVYSDINFILLGEIVHVVSGKPLNEFVEHEVFQPLGMTHTRFLPPAEWRPLIAPTELFNGVPWRGVVHDETARAMGGVAGHAGLFTTAEDLSKFAQMMLNLGEYNGVRVFSPLTVRKFTEPNTPPHQPVLRGLGWDIDSPFSSNRGELFPLGSYGHTGFTGTSIWLDPSTKTYVIILTNAVHPKRGTAMMATRAKIATLTAAALGIDVPGSILTTVNETSQSAPARVTGRTVETLNGIDVLAQDGFAKLKGKRVGLITNQTGLLRDHQRNLDAMLAAGVKVTALFSPEHGIEGKVDDALAVAHSKDAKTGIGIWSLYSGKNRRPSQAMLQDVDVLVFDIQDVGARFYTYATTMKYAMEAAAQAKLPFIVLDRPNPINGIAVEGPLLDTDLFSFIGCSRIPLRHGMTMGELARWFNGVDHVNADLEVIPVKNWQRTDWWDATTLPWTNPSPNMRSLNAALLYPGVAMLEFAPNWSVGRGTDAPFEQAGAEWLKGAEFAAYLNRQFIPGIRFYPTRFVPESGALKGKTLEGVRFVITDREAFSPIRLGLEIAAALEELYPGKINLDKCAPLIGSREVLRALRNGTDAETIEGGFREPIEEFKAQRKPYLLYE